MLLSPDRTATCVTERGLSNVSQLFVSAGRQMHIQVHWIDSDESQIGLSAEERRGGDIDGHALDDLQLKSMYSSNGSKSNSCKSETHVAEERMWGIERMKVSHVWRVIRFCGRLQNPGAGVLGYFSGHECRGGEKIKVFVYGKAIQFLGRLQIRVPVLSISAVMSIDISQA